MVAANMVTISTGRAQDWINTVINPVLDGIRRELRFLPSGPWRWQPNTRSFEFFLPAKAYVPHPYGDNYDDFVEKYDGMREALAAHDGLLTAFTEKFERAYDALSADRRSFKSALDASLAERGRYGGGGLRRRAIGLSATSQEVSSACPTIMSATRGTTIAPVRSSRPVAAFSAKPRSMLVATPKISQIMMSCSRSNSSVCGATWRITTAPAFVRRDRS